MKLEINKLFIKQVLHWAIFLLTSIALTMKIVEVSAYETSRIILHNPEVGQYAQLVNYGYLPF